MEILDITVLSAEQLSLGQRPIKKNAFVALRTDSQNQATTALHADGGSYPHWNQRLTLAMPPSSRSVTVEVRCKTGADVRTLGRVTIPAADFHGGLLPAGTSTSSATASETPTGTAMGLLISPSEYGPRHRHRRRRRFRGRGRSCTALFGRSLGEHEVMRSTSNLSIKIVKSKKKIIILDSL
ncbi:unnamed protein product [Spirodela intermedia]|uniref:C2 domain-containing protein n=1 Tax=Spirodela intermedia TaxID=51605 RepID=A0A7I8IGZ3_SPIIN|nr:unnamed protein product [Spirodela intermedia]CAA6656333.1 unnamed protein product [Spirodela intermedia]